MRKTLAILSLPLLLASCQYIDKVPSKDKLLEEELKTINWKEVDQLPSVAECDSLTDSAQQQACFFSYLTREVQTKLEPETLSAMYPELDTIEVKVTVFPDSTLKFEPLFHKEPVVYDTIQIDSILHARLVDFPKINPATKRGIPVKSQFLLPVILKMN